MKNYEARRSQFINDLETILYGADLMEVLYIDSDTLEMTLSPEGANELNSYPVSDLMNPEGCLYGATRDLVDDYVFEHN